MNSKKSRLFNYAVFIIMDSVLITISYMLSLVFLSLIEYTYVFTGLPQAIILIILFKVIVFHFIGVYRMMVDFIDFKSVGKIVFAVLLTNVSIVLVMLFDFIPTFIPKTMFLFITSIEIIILVGYRLIRPLLNYLQIRRTQQKLSSKRTIVIGAGAAGQMVLKELKINKNHNNFVIGFLDDSVEKQGHTLSNKKVLGKIEDLDAIVKKHNIDEVIIAIKDYSRSKLNNLYNKINNYESVSVKKVSLFENPNSPINITNINVEDLLNRDEISLDSAEIYGFIKDEIVIVTGGGGSIGSELCRQIFTLEPKKLIIFDIYENNAYDIQMELERIQSKDKNYTTEIITLIGSVYNEIRLEEVFSKYRPTIVFHAAAYKHVPLMEESPKEAIRTNVIGTNNTAKLANKYKVKKMVLVSSDKAVRSTNVMGATKRFAELIVDHHNKNGNTMFSSVRFGNVLGSNGSVIPLFKKQIEDGGPITVTHKDITRYFMTIPEAVGLILQCGVYAKGGEVFILDMGEPVKIYDLAVKMIKLMGLRPFIDINIDIVGLRPGEKLYEELLVDPTKNGNVETDHSRIFIEKETNETDIIRSIKDLKNKYEKVDNYQLKLMLADIIKTYQVDGDDNQNTDKMLRITGDDNENT